MDRQCLILLETLTPKIGPPDMCVQLAIAALTQLHARWPLAGCAVTGGQLGWPRIISVGRN